ncbi:MAG: helix-turn-helix transcriptional regulator [Desulfuromonadaceae bacterium]|jgi:putative transcriptional regulator
MIRFRLKEMIAEKEFRDGERLSIGKISQETGIHRSTISRIASQKGYNTTTENIDRLCNFFECSVDEIMEHIPD